MSLTEDEKYAIMANVPYQIHEGVPMDLIEEELRLYGLDHEIDRELSDRISAVLHNDNEVVHSIRGTDKTNIKDLLTDIALIASNPVVAKTFGTLTALRFPNLFRLGNPDLDIPKLLGGEEQELTSGFYKNLRQARLGDRLEIMEQGGENMEEFMDDIMRLDRKEKQFLLKEAKQATEFQAKEAKGQVKGGLTATAFSKLPDFTRINREREKLQNVINKYQFDKEYSLTGHSLGSVANILGRENDIKTITFNPAPQSTDGDPHPDSKVYRIKGDIVSFKGFRTDEDTEPVTEFEPRFGNNPFDYHGLKQFIPPKPKINIGKVINSPFNYRPAVYNNKRISTKFDYCKEFPYLDECSVSREKMWF